MTPIRMFIRGIPQPKGSTRAFMKPGMRFPVVTSDNPKLKAWEKAIQTAALLEARGRQPFEGPIEMTAVFTFERPASVSETKRPSHIVKPDLSKLVRGIEDAISGLVFVDDAQIVTTHSYKQYGAVPGVEITLQPAATRSLFTEQDRAS